jgi:hypothetical protein
MKMQCRAAWMLVAVLALAQRAGGAGTQQDEGPILKPKPKPVTTATLVVMCDLACYWNLDGELEGIIALGESKKVPVSLGHHRFEAVTMDKLDVVVREIEIKTPGQTIVSIELQPVREARGKAAEARRHEEEREEYSKIWTDPATNLMWMKEDSGGDGDTWQQANDYCRTLKFAGNADWRLPTIDELQGIYDPNTNVDGDHVNSALKLTLPYAEWSSSQEYASGEALIFDFRNGWRLSYQLDIHYHNRALCVRRAGG